MSRLLTLTEWMAKEDVSRSEVAETCGLTSSQVGGYITKFSIPRRANRERIEALTGPLEWSREVQIEVMTGRLAFKDSMSLREWLTVRCMKQRVLARKSGATTTVVWYAVNGYGVRQPQRELIEAVTGPLDWSGNTKARKEPAKPKRELEPLGRSGVECAAAVGELSVPELRRMISALEENSPGVARLLLQEFHSTERIK